MTLFEIQLVLGGLIVVLLGVVVGTAWSPVIGATLAGAPLALVAFTPIADAVLTWYERRPKPLPRARVIR